MPFKKNGTLEVAINKEESSTQAFSKSRRNFMSSTATASALGLVGAAGTSSLLVSGTAHASTKNSSTHDNENGRSNKRAKDAADLKIDLAKEQERETRHLAKQNTNGDEQRYEDENFYASFYKSLPQNDFGEVNSTIFQRLQTAMRSGSPQDFATVLLDPSAQRPLENPQGAFRFEMTGLDSHATHMPPAPAFRSAQASAEMGELYWQAITRDVPFIDYGANALINNAVTDLNQFSETVGPKSSGSVTAQTLFRGETPADLNGPYISQLLLKDVPYGPSTIEQKYQVPLAGSDFMVDPVNWINVQRGANPNEAVGFETDLRYLFNNRALGEYVHRDVLFQAYFNAALILLSMGPAALDQGNPYLNTPNQSPFTSLGGPWLLQVLTYASNLSLSGAWFQKWRVHRRLRPEAYGGRIHFNQTGQRNYEIHSDVLNSSAMDFVHSQYGSYFLPMAFTEGSPRHPAYPAGHATIAGACCTVLKAFFNEDFILPNTVQADVTGHNLIPYNDSALTLGGEVNKLANNVSIGRNAAGVHYRTDGVDGMAVGEQQAIRLLRDQVRGFNEDFPGFTLTKFDGMQITIS